MDAAHTLAPVRLVEAGNAFASQFRKSLAGACPAHRDERAASLNLLIL